MWGTWTWTWMCGRQQQARHGNDEERRMVFAADSTEQLFTLSWISGVGGGDVPGWFNLPERRRARCVSARWRETFDFVRVN